MKKQLYSVPILVSLLVASFIANAQYPNRCNDISARANSNGQASNCAGVSGTPIASNFAGTSYATVPSTLKTADITFKYSNTDPATLKPFAITKISGVSGGVTTVYTTIAGPASVPSLTGANDALVKYCLYTTNLPTAGTLIIELTNPETGQVVGSCSYDASCTDNCVTSTNTLLPVRLTGFTAKRSGNQVQLKWTTEEESGIRSYEVERSQNGVQFERIGTIHSRTNTAANEYAFTDQQPAGTNYYRLKIMHDNGSFEYSNTIQAKNTAATATIESITPNPFKGEIVIKVSLPKSQILTVQLSDFTGRQLKQVKTTASAGTSKLTLDNLASLPTGSYVVRIQTESEVLTQKITK